MQNRKLAQFLQKVEARQDENQDDQLLSINDEMAKNIRAVYGGGNGVCNNNGSCDNNGSCSNNTSGPGPNGTCNGSCTKEIEVIEEAGAA